MSAAITIGLPTYNRPEYLRQAIDSLLAQTFRDFQLVISDNASENPAVGELIESYVAHDSRISAVRRTENIGAELNFRDLMTACDTPFFMWASDDDIWEPTFLAHMTDLLNRNPQAQMAAAAIDNINAKGVQIRTYKDFSRFSSSASRIEDARRFILDSEILGKANMIYGLFRTPALQAVCAENWNKAGFSEWGGDNVLLFAFVSRHPIVVSDQVLIHKRVPVESDALVRIDHPALHFVPKQHYKSYVARHVRVSPTDTIAALAKQLLLRRRLARMMLHPARKWISTWRSLSRHTASLLGKGE